VYKSTNHHENTGVGLDNGGAEGSAARRTTIFSIKVRVNMWCDLFK
jgi:hypothetical protein